ncbi:Mini-ribonuclease 3 [uncultured Robinsoniella sp.]|uniref:Mini-ribonuclease 3 n=1 Tax=uncultured Robinsoniella sp. TaxID=904190 RepID=UPI00374FA540
MEKGLDLFSDYLKEQFKLEDLDMKTYSPLTLAYIGDSIYDLIIRTLVVCQGNCPANKLHKRSSALVKASAQAEMIEKIMPLLTEEEEQIYKRGRNAKSYTMAKNASMLDYRKATGFEALMGYLYLENQMHRMIDLVKEGIRSLENVDSNVRKKINVDKVSDVMSENTKSVSEN